MFKSIFSLIFPSLAARPTRRKKRRKKGAERVSEHNFMPSGTEGASGIPKLLVADFEGDSKAQATVHLTETLSRAGQWDVFRTKKVIKVGPGKDPARPPGRVGRDRPRISRRRKSGPSFVGRH